MAFRRGGLAMMSFASVCLSTSSALVLSSLRHPAVLPARRLRVSGQRTLVQLMATEASSKPSKGKKQQKGKKGGQDSGDVITPRQEDYAQWYQDVVYASDLVDQSPVRGCMVIKPWGMAIWDNLRNDLDRRISDSGASNAYFPLFIPQSFLSKEAEHVEGFAKECAVVTHHRLCASPDGNGLIPDPDAELEEPLIVRPTSETVIWNMLSKWINSHRDLPLKLNQWANVVRWEMRTRPFLRTSEFLWQEGHTAHSTSEEALQCAKDMLDIYADVCEDMLAVPVVKGVKSASERFAGADETFTIEALMQNGWALQSGTSHFLGQNFARAFDVEFQSRDGKRELVWATSWGVSTRLVGAMVMTHADDAGLVLPPAVAPVQVVIVPILGKTPEDRQAVESAIDDVLAELKAENVRVKVDDRENVRPGAKYFEWERKGVPLRVELGPRDVSSSIAMMKSRLGGDKQQISLEGIGARIATELQGVQSQMLEAAKARLEERTIPLTSYDEMRARLESDDPSQSGLFLVPWCDDAANEDKIKEETKATIRCYPLDQQEHVDGKTCFYSGKPATHMAIFARAF